MGNGEIAPVSRAALAAHPENQALTGWLTAVSPILEEPAFSLGL